MLSSLLFENGVGPCAKTGTRWRCLRAWAIYKKYSATPELQPEWVCLQRVNQPTNRGAATVNRWVLKQGNCIEDWMRRVDCQGPCNSSTQIAWRCQSKQSSWSCKRLAMGARTEGSCGTLKSIVVPDLNTQTVGYTPVLARCPCGSLHSKAIAILIKHGLRRYWQLAK